MSIARFRPAKFGRFWPVFFFADHTGARVLSSFVFLDTMAFAKSAETNRRGTGSAIGKPRGSAQSLLEVSIREPQLPAHHVADLCAALFQKRPEAAVVQHLSIDRGAVHFAIAHIGKVLLWVLVALVLIPAFGKYPEVAEVIDLQLFFLRRTDRGKM